MRFRDIESQMVSPVVDETFGETTRIAPQAQTEHSRRGPDPGRPAYDAWGIVDEAPKIVRGKDSGRDDADTADIAGSRTDISYAISTLGPRERWPKVGDRIEALDPPRSYVVAAEPQDDGVGRVIVKVQRAK